MEYVSWKAILFGIFDELMIDMYDKFDKIEERKLDDGCFFFFDFNLSEE